MSMTAVRPNHDVFVRGAPVTNETATHAGSVVKYRFEPNSVGTSLLSNTLGVESQRQLVATANLPHSYDMRSTWAGSDMCRELKMCGVSFNVMQVSLPNTSKPQNQTHPTQAKICYQSHCCSSQMSSYGCRAFFVLLLVCLSAAGADARQHGVLNGLQTATGLQQAAAVSSVGMNVLPSDVKPVGPAVSLAPETADAQMMTSISYMAASDAAAVAETAAADVAVAADPIDSAAAAVSGETAVTTASATSSSTVTTASTTAVEVIVIGAGLAGLKAAADLRARGYNVVVLEGRDRIGGRVHSAKMSPTSTYTVEAGAQWLHGDGRTNPVYTLVRDTLRVTPVVTGGSSQLRTTSSTALVRGTDISSFWTT
jgi:hypothetical protein